MVLRLAVILLVFSVVVYAQDRSYGRSMVITRDGIVATSHVQASVAGAQILAKGGSAVDAAIAANAVLGVTEPMMNGIGGDLFAIYWDAKTGQALWLECERMGAAGTDARAPEGERRDPDADRGDRHGHGSRARWMAGRSCTSRFGKLPWQELFQPAIFFAEQGYAGAGTDSRFLGVTATRGLQTNAESQRVFLPGGKPPELGEIFRNPDLADALRLIAEQGASAFYKGEIAKAILETSQDLGGTMTADDLARIRAEWVEPISTTYRGWTVYELPPNGQGMAALEMLNIMEQSRRRRREGRTSPAELHKKIEAMKLAYADLQRYDADPRFAKVPVERPAFEGIRARARRADRSCKANCDVAPGAPARATRPISPWLIRTAISFR